MRSVSFRIPVSSCCNPTAHGGTAPKRPPHPASRSSTTTAGRYGPPANTGPSEPIRNGHFLEYRIIDSGPLADEKGEVDPFAGRDPFANAEDIPQFCGPPAPVKVAKFDVYFGDTGEKAAFHILDCGGSSRLQSYRVIESSREKWTPPKGRSAEDDPIPPADFPAISARKLGRLPVEAGGWNVSHRHRCDRARPGGHDPCAR